MADINHVISLGIGSPAGIQEFLTFGLQQGAAVVPPTDLTVTPAGRRHRRRFFVEIDGQTFEVRDPQHAQALLDRAREIARAHAEQLTRETVSRETFRKIGKKPVALKTPQITSPNPELREVVSQARKSINEVYRSTALDTELALLLARRLAEEDEEEALLLLM